MNEEECPGPLVWYEVAGDGAFFSAAILECAACGYLITSGNFHDNAHAATPLLKEDRAA